MKYIYRLQKLILHALYLLTPRNPIRVQRRIFPLIFAKVIDLAIECQIGFHARDEFAPVFIFIEKIVDVSVILPAAYVVEVSIFGVLDF
jgi:hypothetical protein